MTPPIGPPKTYIPHFKKATYLTINPNIFKMEKISKISDVEFTALVNGVIQ